jgi:hypothetical protein
MDKIATTSYFHGQNIRLIELAFDCVFINSSEKKIIGLLEEKQNESEDSDVNVTDIFKQEKFITKKRMAYLLAFDESLQTRSLDQQFGRLATAKNEKLLDVLNDLEETQAEKDHINKRFGVLAIKRELATIEQIKAALDIQNNERQTQKETRFIGQILQETADFSDNDILQILLEQKQFEKRRLDLEKALYTFKSEFKISKKLNRFFEYHISKSGLEAIVIKRMKIDQTIPTYEFHIWLRRVGIKFCVATDAVLENFIQTAQKNSQLIVAKGYPPEQCTNESIQFYYRNEACPVQQNPDNL